MACGDKYRDLIVTSDGRTPADPCWAFCGAGDYNEWFDVLRAVADEVFTRWDYLLSVEQKIEATPEADRPVQSAYPERDQVLHLVQDFAKKNEANRHPLEEAFSLGSLTWSGAVTRAIQAAELGACVLERLDEAVAYYDAAPLPKTGHDKPTKPAAGLLGSLGLDNWLLLGGVVVAIVLLVRQGRGKSSGALRSAA